MTTITTSPLDANLAALGDRQQALGTRIRATAPAAISFADAEDGITGTLEGTALASRRRPRAEGAQLADRVDIIENAAIVVLGFGLGWHVEALAKRLDQTGVIVVYEPDLSLLHAVFDRIDHSSWLRKSNVVIATSIDDRGELSTLLEGGESIVGQGVAFVEHPASRRRLGDRGATFTRLFADWLSGAKVTLVTTLMRTVETMRNYLYNARTYIGGSGINDLAGAAAGAPAVTIAAGPSLTRNVDALAAARDRCVLIAAQTTLKPLLERGIRPHYVTALDYHEISKRFYEGLSAGDVDGITLVVDPKAHPSILATWPGAIRCCAAPPVDKMLGADAIDHGELKAGATVAHLSLYLAQHLGCNPIAMIGQDLGFPEGLYYAPGTAIHDVWAPELNAFNTIAMMEWQRIVRHRTHLHQLDDVNGRPIYTDTQMLTYLQQFERDFARLHEEGTRVVDATEGGVRKHNAESTQLASFLEEHATAALPELPAPAPFDTRRVRDAVTRFRTVRQEVGAIGATSRRTIKLLDEMIAAGDDQTVLDRLFARIGEERRDIERRFETFDLISAFNQLGVFKRMKADRRIHLMRDADPHTRQRAQLDRDRVNVAWIADAADQFAEQLEDAIAQLEDRPLTRTPEPLVDPLEGSAPTSTRVAAVIPIDPDHDALGRPRSLAPETLQATIDRVSGGSAVDAVILLVPDGFNFTPAPSDVPVHLEACGEGPFDDSFEAIRAARRLTPRSWRGAPGGLTSFDELLVVPALKQALERHEADAAVLVSPDWIRVDVTPENGIPAIVARYRERPTQHGLVFTQAPPGLASCLVTRNFLDTLGAGRLGTIGAVLAYQPSIPQADPIARASNVQIDHELRHALVRAGAAEHDALQRMDAAASGSSVAQSLSRAATARPAHVMIELTTRRPAHGVFIRNLGGPATRPDLPADVARALLGQLPRDTVVHFAGLGDPLLHPDALTLIREAAGCVDTVHVRTELDVDHDTIRALAATGVHGVSVDLHADSPATMAVMLGTDRFKQTLDGMQVLLDARHATTGPAGPGGFGLPWIIPRLQRCPETLNDLEGFFDRWQHLFGTAVIEEPVVPSALAPARTPRRVAQQVLAERLFVRSDGSIPTSECGDEAAASIIDTSLEDAWSSLQHARHDRDDLGLIFP